MSAMLDKLFMYLQYPFVVNALIVGVLIALCSSMLGVTLVLKRYSFIGDGLSHVAFGAMAIASVFKMINNNVIVLPLTILAALLQPVLWAALSPALLPTWALLPGASRNLLS